MVSSFAVVSNIVVLGLVMGLVVASVVDDSLDSETILTNITDLNDHGIVNGSGLYKLKTYMLTVSFFIRYNLCQHIFRFSGVLSKPKGIFVK